MVVASVSCIYGLGLPAQYLESASWLQVGDETDPQRLSKTLDRMLYQRPENNWELQRGNYLVNFQVRAESARAK